MLVAGMDVSGNPEDGNYKYISIVIGTEESIRAIMRRFGREQIHMSTIKNSKIQNEIVSRLEFDNKECIGFCYKMELSNMIKKVGSKSTGTRISKRRLFTIVYYAMWSLLQDPVKEFLQRHRCDIHDVIFQYDGDLEGFLKTVGLKHARKDDAQIVADILAWANNRGYEPPGTTSQDLSVEMATLVSKKMKQVRTHISP